MGRGSGDRRPTSLSGLNSSLSSGTPTAARHGKEEVSTVGVMSCSSRYISCRPLCFSTSALSLFLPLPSLPSFSHPISSTKQAPEDSQLPVEMEYTTYSYSTSSSATTAYCSPCPRFQSLSVLDMWVPSSISIVSSIPFSFFTTKDTGGGHSCGMGPRCCRQEASIRRRDLSSLSLFSLEYGIA